MTIINIFSILQKWKSLMWEEINQCIIFIFHFCQLGLKFFFEENKPNFTQALCKWDCDKSRYIIIMFN